MVSCSAMIRTHYVRFRSIQSTRGGGASTTGHASPNRECRTKVWVPVFVAVVIVPITTASFVRFSVMTSACLALTPPSAVIVPSVVAIKVYRGDFQGTLTLARAPCAQAKKIEERNL